MLTIKKLKATFTLAALLTLALAFTIATITTATSTAYAAGSGTLGGVAGESASDGYIYEPSGLVFQYSAGTGWNHSTQASPSKITTTFKAYCATNQSMVVSLYRYIPSSNSWLKVAHTGSFSNGVQVMTNTGGAFGSVVFNREYNTADSLYTTAQYRMVFEVSDKAGGLPSTTVTFN